MLLDKIKNKSKIEIYQAIVYRIKHIPSQLLKESIILLKRIIDFIFPFLKKFYFNEHDKLILNDIRKTSYIVSPNITLKEIEQAIVNQQKGAYLRFGDGDVYLANNRDDMMQKADPSLAKEMAEAFLMKGEGIYKCLMIHSDIFGFESEMFNGNHKINNQLATEIIHLTYRYFVGYRIYSHVALHFVATYNVSNANNFLKTLKKHTGLFIGNEDVPPNIVSLLFGDVVHIKSPSSNSYYQINTIEQNAIKEIEKFNKFKVIVVAMGCSGRPLMKRIWNKGYNVFLFDFGSLLDGICGYQTRTWMKVTNIDYEELLKGL